MKINYLRRDLMNLKAYDAEEKSCIYKMDANESPWDLPDSFREILARDLMDGKDFNRYPDSKSTNLRRAIGEHWGVSSDQVIVGAGSDELIQILITGFAGKGEGVAYPTPSFGMYQIFTLIAGATPMPIELGEGYEYDMEAFTSAISKYNPKVLFICNPNNPTGNLMDPDQLKKLINAFPGVVVIDEAYGEFAKASMIEYAIQVPNLVVLRTFSKAFGLAGLRVGYCITSPELASQINRVMPPYNLNTFSQDAAVLALANREQMDIRVKKIIEQRQIMYNALGKIDGLRIYPSQANFLLIKVPRGHLTWQQLLDRGILVRDFSGEPYLRDCLRVTIACEEANRAFISSMYEIFSEG
ncbi:MAG TPA: histidinol-phosphate transaminase [Clostridia bacterium]|nr:histidinol-phosphate transaminase [Clostridia bacterium]